MAAGIIRQSQFYLIFSFLGMIVLGALLLKAPFVTHKGGLAWLDAFFTSVSSVCVVGMASVPIDGFNTAGQLVVVFLVQAGGLGIMTLTASIIFFLGRDFSWGGKKVLASISDDFPINKINVLIKTIVLYTFAIEFTGFLLLLPGFYWQGHSLGESAYFAFFHAVAAYCNAGFSLYPTSFTGQSVYLKMVISMLVICGGLGFYVIYDILNRRPGTYFQVNTKIVVITSLLLIAGGTLGIKGLEWLGENKTLSWADAFFQSVITRSAGFNSVDMQNLESSTLFIMTMLMLIGASPNSTGGGMKTTTFAVVVLSVWSIVRGHGRVVVFKREISAAYQMKAFAIMIVFLMIVIVCTVFLCATISSSYPLKNIGFEVVSALSTTGLSLGYAEVAAPYGKIALMCCMFLGRLGPFSIFMFLAGRNRHSQLSYPQETVILA
jgi:trk system potassium uptake protein TrkH